MSKTNLTIRDIARLSGVSKSTVSRILNDTGYVSQSTREKVDQVIKEHGYVPNLSAKELSLSKSDTIGIFTGDIGNQYFQEILRGAESVISHSTYFPFICLATSQRRQKLYLDELKSRRVSGIIFSSSYIYDESLMSSLADTAKIISVQTDIPDVMTIDIDNYSAAYAMGDMIAKKGHRKIGYIDSYNPINSLKERLRGFKDALKDNGLSGENLYYTVTGSDYHGNAPAEELLKNKDITVIQCANDQISADAYSVISDAGLSIPEDISLAGFDGLPLNSLIKPKLATIKQPLYEMGKLAAEKLIEMIDNDYYTPETILLDYSVIEGNSVRDL